MYSCICGRSLCVILYVNYVRKYGSQIYVKLHIFKLSLELSRFFSFNFFEHFCRDVIWSLECVILKELIGISQVDTRCLSVTYYRGFSQSLHYKNKNYPNSSDKLLSTEHRNSSCAYKNTKCSILLRCDAASLYNHLR